MWRMMASRQRENLDSVQQNWRKYELVIKTAVFAIIAIFALMIAGGLLFVASGVYNLAADVPHFAPVRWLLITARTRSIEFHSRGIRIPNHRDKSLLKNGFVLYRKNCEPCHGRQACPVSRSAAG